MLDPGGRETHITPVQIQMQPPGRTTRATAAKNSTGRGTCDSGGADPTEGGGEGGGGEKKEGG